MGSLFLNFALRSSLLPENCNFHETFLLKRKLNKKTHFGQKAASWSKIKEKRPHLKLNFTSRASSSYLLRPFLKIGNGISLILVLLLHISTLQNMLTSKSSLSYVLCCKLVNFSRRMESKVSFWNQNFVGYPLAFFLLFPIQPLQFTLKLFDVCAEPRTALNNTHTY